ncbi:MAG: hypothetical protein BWY76_03521 [bacterium ADurb.Bin429]|nr:MAG: hypothetical protein BWY76_03521 [bacterium ADurb.Bin429]
MFSQKFIHDGGRRVNSPCNTCLSTSGRRHDSYGIIQSSVSSFHFGNRVTGIPRNESPPPHSEYRRICAPCAFIAMTSRCKKVSVDFGNVVKR